MLCAADFCLLDGLQVQALHRALGLRDEEDVLHASLAEGDGPVRRVVADGRRYLEAARQLGVDHDLLVQFQLSSKGLLAIRVREHVVLHVLLGLDRAGEVRVLLGREDGAVVGAFRLVVLDLLHNHRGLLLVDQTDGFGDELLRVVLVHGEGLGLDALEDSGGCPARELGSLGHLADQIVANGAALRSVEVVGRAGFRHEADPGFDLLGAPVLSLLALGHGVLQLGDEHLLVDVPDRLVDELLAVERDGVRVLVVDVTPEGLELLLVEVVVERVLTDLGLVAVAYHAVERVLVEHALDQRVHAVRNLPAAIGKRSECVVREVRPVLVRDVVIVVDVVVLDEVAVDVVRLPVADHFLVTVQNDGLSSEVILGRLGRAVVEVLAYAALKVGNEVLVAVACNDGQLVDLLHRVSQHGRIHPVAILVHAEPESPPDLLPLLRRRVAAVLERADLEDVRVVPSFPQGRVREDEAHGIVEREQPLLVLQYQVVGGRIVALVAATLELAVDLAALLVDAEVARMRAVHVDGPEVALVGRVEQRQVLIQDVRVLLLEDVAVLGVRLVAVLVVPAVLRHLVDEEQGQALDAPVEELLLLLEVRADCLTDLNASHVRLRHVAGDLARVNRHAVGETHLTPDRVDRADMVAAILLHAL